jgi:hypothetical protein
LLLRRFARGKWWRSGARVAVCVGGGLALASCGHTASRHVARLTVDVPQITTGLPFKYRVAGRLSVPPGRYGYVYLYFARPRECGGTYAKFGLPGVAFESLAAGPLPTGRAFAFNLQADGPEPNTTSYYCFYLVVAGSRTPSRRAKVRTRVQVRVSTRGYGTLGAVRINRVSTRVERATRALSTRCGRACLDLWMSTRRRSMSTLCCRADD